MPQPFRYRQGEMHYGAPALSARPELALKIALVMDRWSSFEYQMAVGFVFLVGGAEEGVGGAEEGALVIYNSLIDRNLRETVFLALIRSRLSTALVDRFTDLFKQVRKAASARNDIAHGQWATISTRPESLLLCPTDFRLKQVHDWSKWLSQLQQVSFLDALHQPKPGLGRFLHLLTRFDSKRATFTLPDIPSLDMPKNTEFTEYTARDFDDLITRLENLKEGLWSLLLEARKEFLLRDLERIGSQDALRSPNSP